MMKLGTLAIVILLGMTSCEKETLEEAITETSESTESTETVDVNVESGKTYSYSLGNRSSVAAQIQAQASHASVSRITIVPASSTSSYVYLPDSTYTGTDSVTVLISSGSSGGCGKKHKSDSLRLKRTFRFHVIKN